MSESEAPQRGHQRFDCATQPEQALAAAESAIAAGECIVLPTDTVYGIGANAFDGDAVQRLLEAKERGRDMPPPVLVAEPLMLRAVAEEVPDAALALAKAFWPGALTLILRAQPKAGMELGETGGTVAVRVPDHEAARALLRRTGPLAVSSANVHGQAPALTCEEAVRQLGDRVAVYLDAGPAAGGVASTIVDFVAFPEGRIVREGALSESELREVAPQLIGLPEPEAEREGAPTPEILDRVERPADPGVDEVSGEPDDQGEQATAEHVERGESGA